MDIYLHDCLQIVLVWIKFNEWFHRFLSDSLLIAMRLHRLDLVAELLQFSCNIVVY